MLARSFNRGIVIAAFTVVCYGSSVSAQTPVPPKKPTQPTPTSVESVETKSLAPQVVTIVHRLNGLKMFRMLLRSDKQVEAIGALDEEINLLEDVHTNIIAGLALGDGKTIVAWLPEADVEFGPRVIPPFPPRAPRAKQAPRVSIPKWPATFAFRGGMFGSPDLTVIGPNGKKLEAEYIGLDAATGLSVLRVSEKGLTITTELQHEPIELGESVKVIGPEPANNAAGVSRRGLLVRMGTTDGRVLDVTRAPTGGVISRFKVQAPRLSLANIGGVAVNEAGETIGIVDGVEGTEATVLPTTLVRRAADRVLAQQASVPRPWLGVRGEAVSRMNIEQFKSLGWKTERATSLVEKHLGILLTSIADGSPAASAALRPGDVILKVNNEEVGNADDFSWMLDQAGPSSSVTFTLARPDRLGEEFVNVELSGLLDPNVSVSSNDSLLTASLMTKGIEAVALKHPAATKLGVTGGLLVIYVDPSTSAFDAGLRPGDVINTIDGKPLPADQKLSFDSVSSSAISTFEVVRKKQRLVITISSTNKK